MDLMFQPFRKYFDFEGRARRSEYWLFALFVFIAVVACEMVAAVGEGLSMPALRILGGFGVLIVALATLIPSLALHIRRLHDTNRTGWWLLIGLLPFFGAIVLFVFSLLEGTPGSNRFGDDPKGRAATPTGDVAKEFA